MESLYTPPVQPQAREYYTQEDVISQGDLVGYDYGKERVETVVDYVVLALDSYVVEGVHLRDGEILSLEDLYHVEQEAK